jgi:hypothetical protein
MPSKLKLNLDVAQLHVESFEPQVPERADRGTVRGNDLMVSVDYTCYDYTCRGYGTCGIYPCKPLP